MLSLPWFFYLNKYISEKFYRPPPCANSLFLSFTFLGGSIMDDYLTSFREMISLRGLTDHTVKSYSTYIRAYLAYLSDVLHKDPYDVSWYELRDFIRWLQAERSLSDRTINIVISQLRFFTIYVLHKPWDPSQLPMRRFDEYLPFVPSREQASLFLSSIPDLKLKAIVSLLYASGLRVSEACRLRYSDISRKHMRIYISSSKNRSARYALLSKNSLDILTAYWYAYGRPTGWLFPARRDPSKPYSSNNVMRHMAEHEARLGWEHRITTHSWRHAFGTHLYENGTDLLTIKALLGHKSINSTVIYVHLAGGAIRSTVSPFDCLGGDWDG